ncbi:LAQU0S18e01904g1_1 [Lachancea quebecensis]|uniref:LAQU0S18e01904g1_1 n=1 Tax=Lachancea quebecensis TaxID=1654605 RepID=A0A0P1KWU7_9SACH|nr:LAQU0S18e01904g1_1 [Lachancea quebecensis]
MVSEEIWVDETTHYSVLGLKSDASESQIKKAYRKIAMAIHPDKNKSASAAEMFKLVSHAQSILIDKELRRSYNRSLISKGLYAYAPKKTKLSALVTAASGSVSGSSNSSPRKTKESQSAHASAPNPATPSRDKMRPSTAFSRKSKPYEQQPYGFGVDNDVRGSPFASQDKPFKAKSYQHQRPSNNHAAADAKLGSSTFSSRFPSSAPEHDIPHSADEGPSTPFSEGKRAKLPKKDTQGFIPDPPGSPFPSNFHRHHARTSHNDKQQNRRSTSPVKNQPTSTTDTLQGLKDILDKFKTSKASSVIADEAIGLDEHGGDPNSTKEASKISQTDTQKGFRVNESGLDSIPSSKMGDHTTVDGGTTPQDKARKRPIVGQKTELSKTRETADIRLTELENVLPKDDEFFDMRQVSDTLDNVRVKRLKTERAHSPEVNMMEDSHPSPLFPYEVGAETLSRPVNETLPRIYKPELVSATELGINESMVDLSLPALPALQINVLDKQQVLQTIQVIKNFNSHANKLKSRLLDILSRRSTADDLFNERLIRVENTNILLQAKAYDLRVAEKLQELQNRQRVVAESFATLMGSIYASKKR